ncbi:right-handed parallel beta-helix repeat-containing protein [Halanaerobium sp. ST460_2HS_T2]|uniref:right-handed parallel beta-helix repeat-containing protein n=1 Tax=Halanaerobium sp. ST460_2HS_T2 TaxID=2183914 RepID=UPI000DF47F2C|nr:right-handed parallel beta-helix repeat-containing protein [Halanaerobium sp. ST460_2HS_T2]RCW61891.1 uncharacterized protein DUF1565 [Halanaerobium sp. ST460_2HS_T2]
MSFEYHVSKKGSDFNSGTKEEPFLTINKAAAAAQAGDTVIVHEGTYREWVKPQNRGLSESRRITYQAAKNEKVVIKGSEKINDWENVEDSIWKTEIDNQIFGEYNPYQKEIFGDWLIHTGGQETKHLGDVYLNGMSFYEVDSYDKLVDPEVKTEIKDDWTGKIDKVKNPEQTKYLWYVEVDEEKTTIYANFHESDPNQELVEINVRKACFYPETNGIDYITVKGFEMAQAATPWTPPTADQPGLIGPNWAKGWIIEDNIIHDSKCSAISIGKTAATGDNFRSKRQDKPGYKYQIESVFEAEAYGWNKDNVGSHIIRNNEIYDCGQNGVVGHLGCIFSEIYNNHIYNIALKREFYGHEIAGIKLHAPIDVEIHDNRIHNCSLGTWMDWQTQGTRISSNLYYNNNRDLFIEVSHGPYIVDNNILASDYALDNFSQGGAYVNNLIAGKMVHRKILKRSTPYHQPHSTKIKGFTVILGGDDRFYNNIFIGLEGMDDIIEVDHGATSNDKAKEGVGTAHFNNYTASLEEYFNKVHQKPGDVEIFMDTNQPVYINNNLYLNGALPFEREERNYIEADFNPELSIRESGEDVYLECKLTSDFENIKADIQSTENFEKVRITDADFENKLGEKIVFDKDYLGENFIPKASIGPLAVLKNGNNSVKVWSK